MAHFFSHYSNWWCGPGAFVHGPVGLVLTLLFWGAIIFFLVKLIQGLMSYMSPNKAHNLQVLQQRYACGEIDEATYEKIKKELTRR